MLLSDAQRTELLGHIRAYAESAGPYYDELFDQVGERLRAQGHATKGDIGALVLWKGVSPIAFARKLNAMADRDVQKISAAALSEGLDPDERLPALADIPGMKSQGPIATTLLAAFDPLEFGVYDRRARSALLKLDLPQERPPRYLRLLRQLRDELRELDPKVTARDIDKGLYHLGGETAT